MRFDKSVEFLCTATLALIVAAPVFAREGHRGANAARNTQPHTRTTERQRTENGRTRSDTWTRADGKTASRDAVVTNDREAGTRTRNASYTTFDRREGSMSDVIQRTDDGFSRDTTRTLPNGETHTRNVDVSCAKDVGKCVKQVEVDQPSTKP